MNEWEEQKIDLELQLEQYKARTKALDEELEIFAETCAIEIANLKSALAKY